MTSEMTPNFYSHQFSTNPVNHYTYTDNRISVIGKWCNKENVQGLFTAQEQNWPEQVNPSYMKRSLVHVSQRQGYTSYWLAVAKLGLLELG